MISVRQQSLQEDGSYQFDTILPGRYLNGSTYRPSHIHVRVRWDDENGSNDFISQLYFEGDPFLQSLTLGRKSHGRLHSKAVRVKGWTTSFDFVV